jgi:hypothetical protein
VINQLAARLFGRHIWGSAYDCVAGCREFGRSSRLVPLGPTNFEELGQTKVKYLCTCRRDLDVGGLEIPVDNALSMCRCNGRGDLRTKSKSVLNRQRPAAKALRQSIARKVLHDEKGDAALGAHIEEGADVGMRQGRDSPRFTIESPDGIRVDSDRIRQDFDGNPAAEANVATLIDFTHPAYAKLGDNFVMPQFCTYHDGIR